MLREFWTGLSSVVVARASTPSVPAAEVPPALSRARVLPADWRWPRPRPNGTQLLYFARGPLGLVKIGASTKPLSRVRALNAPHGLKLQKSRLGFGGRHELALIVGAGSYQREHALHVVLREERVGGEWFRGEATERVLNELLSCAIPYAVVLAANDDVTAKAAPLNKEANDAA